MSLTERSDRPKEPRERTLESIKMFVKKKQYHIIRHYRYIVTKERTLMP